MQNIALQVTLNGIPQAVTNLRELEAAILEAKTVLASTTVIGSDEFKKLSSEISAAESKLKNFKNAAKGKDVAGNLADIGKLGGAIAGSFATATAAVSLFGTESESITKAATTAQNALTIALGAKSAAEGLGVVKTIAANIAQRALTASTVATTAATRAFYTVLAANPYGAILAAVGLLIAALVLLTKTESDNEKQAKAATKANDAYAESIKTAGLSAKSTADTVGFLIDELNKNNIALEDALPLLEKLAGNLKNVDLTTEQGRKTLNSYVTALASFSTISDQISAKETEYADAVKNNNQRRIVAIRAERRELQLQLAEQVANIKKIEEADIQAGKDREARLEAAAKAQEKRIQKQIQENLLEIESKTLIVGANTKISETENTLSTSLQKKLELLKSTAAALNQTRTFTEDYLEVLMATTTENDNFGDTFSKIRKQAELFFKEVGRGSMTAANASVALREFRKEALANSNEVFSEAKQIQLAEYTKKYEDIFTIIGRTKTLRPGAGFETFSQQLEQALLDVALLDEELDISIDPFIARSPERKAEAKRNAQAELDEVQELYVNWFMETNKVASGFFIANEEGQEKILTSLKELGEQSFIQLQTAGREAIKLENDFKLGAKSIAEFNAQIVGLSDAAIGGLILSNKELITSLYEIDFSEVIVSRRKLVKLDEQIASERFDIEKDFNYDVEVLNEQFSEKIPAFAKLSYEAKLLILREYLKKEVEATESAEKEKQDATQKTVDNILNTIGQLQAALGAIQATTSDFFSFQFDQLEKRYQRIQDSLIEDTAENNAKRIEAEKIYNAEKARLEKQAAKASLRIQLAQTIANAAQAITVALTAGPLVGQILAGVVAAASLAQIAIVTAQLNAVDSYRRGGVLKSYATGGYVRGPSHENGGVKFQGGGIELEGRESVINRVSTVRYQDLLNQINLAGGGSPIMANLDDSRIVEAIATQRREPIRAYVVQSEITSSQNIQKRLELLSQI